MGEVLTATLEVVGDGPSTILNLLDDPWDVDEISQLWGDIGADALHMCHPNPLAAIWRRTPPKNHRPARGNQLVLLLLALARTHLSLRRHRRNHDHRHHHQHRHQ